MKPTYTYRATVARIVDGDTIDLIVDPGFRATLQIRTRLLGIDAPERFTDHGRACIAALRAWMPEGSDVMVQTYKEPGEKYGRWLATIEHDGTSVADWLRAEGFWKQPEGAQP